MRSFKWISGRQGGGYSKMLIIPLWLSTLMKIDIYFLYFPTGVEVKKHKDPAKEGFKHYRMNITLWNSGNNRMYILGPIKRAWRVEIFRPDSYEHGLRPVTGNLLMLSIGWLRR